MYRRILAWAAVFLGTVAGAGVGVGAYTFIYAKGFSYMSNDAQVCANCHIMQHHYDAWAKSSHHAVAVCNDCHTPPGFVAKYAVKALNGWNHSRAFTLQDFHEPIRITPPNSAILQANCLHCHAGMVSEIEAHGGTDATDCMHCHRSVGHGR